MPRVALVDPSLFTLPYDGALAGALAAAGADVSLWGRPLRPGERLDAPGVQFEPRFFRREEGLGGGVRRLAKAVGSLNAWGPVVGALAAWSPDVIHLQWLTAPLIDRARIRGLRRLAPVLVTVHDARPFQGAAPALQRAGWFGALQQADALLVHHACTEAALRGAGVDRPVHRVQHGPLPGRTVGTPEPGLLVQFGAIKPYKGHDVLLRALVELPDHRLLIAGPPGPGAERLPALARSLGVAGRVTFDLRHVPEDELDALLGRADAFVLPYRAADASGVLWRVAALGRPVVASAVGGLAEDLRDGVTAALVPPGDARALADAVLGLDPATGPRLAEEAELRGWPGIARRHLEIYAGVQQPAT